MKDFFISYNSADKEWAEWIAWQLEEAGHTTVFQAWDFLPGENFVIGMHEAAKDTHSTIIVLTPAFMESKFVQPEWAAALRQDPQGKARKLIPVRVVECEPKGLLAPIVYIDLVGLKGMDAQEKLLNGVKAERIKPSSRPVFPGDSRRSVIAEPDYPGLGRSAVKGLRPFEFDDAELFLRLQREYMLNECFNAITHGDFRLGILFGESGCGKTSFLQAGLWPMLVRRSEIHHPIYIKFTNLDPFESVRQAVVEQTHLSKNDLGDRDLSAIFEKAAHTEEKKLVLLFDQFEQFFVHHQRQEERQPLIIALANWYQKGSTLPVKILFCFREDFYARQGELQQVLGYSLGPQASFHLKKFTPREATEIFQVMSETADLTFDKEFVKEMTEQELANREDGLISPVDVQILAWLISGYKGEDTSGFNKVIYQKMGGIEGLLENYLSRAMTTIAPESQKQVVLKVLLALIDLERNVRAGALTLDQIQQKVATDIGTVELQKAVAWLAQSEVRLITPVRRNGTHGYELAHERLIQPLRRLVNKELSAIDQANILLERRVNEWLGNNRADRYLFNWRELRRIKTQNPYLVWGKQERQKQELLKRSQKRFRRRAAVGFIPVVLILFLVLRWQSVWDIVERHLERRQAELYREQLASRATDLEATQRRQQLGIEFVNVAGDTFEMGNMWGDGEEDEKPVHPVTFSGFKLSKHEITNEQYCAFLNEQGNQEEGGETWIYTPYSKIENRDSIFVPEDGYVNHPVVYVSWYGANAFAEWIGGGLPTEAQWEYAARSGGLKDRKYPWSGEFDGSKVNFADKNAPYDYASQEWDDGFAGTAPVGSYSPNDLGLYDMAGNVYEWCQDWFGDYRENSQTDPIGAYRGEFRVLRGGSFFDGVGDHRCSNRNRFNPKFRLFSIGFRVVASL